MNYITANKTKLTGALLVAFGVLQTQSETIRSLLTPEKYALLTIFIGVAVAVLGFLNSNGTLVPPTDKKNGGFARVGLLGVLLVGSLVACASMNPWGAANGPDEKAYAVLGTYSVYQRQVLAIVQDASLPAGVRRAAASSEQRAYPVIKSLDAAFDAYLSEKTLFDQGKATEGAVKTALANLNRWVLEAQAIVADLKQAVTSARARPVASTAAPVALQLGSI